MDLIQINEFFVNPEHINYIEKFEDNIKKRLEYRVVFTGQAHICLTQKEFNEFRRINALI